MQFTDVAAAPLPALPLLLDEAHHKVVYHHLVVALSPAEYRLFYTLWMARERCWQSAGRIPPVLSVETLAHVTQMSPAQVKRLISRANQKLAAHPQALVIVSLRSFGYELRRRSEVEPTS